MSHPLGLVFFHGKEMRDTLKSENLGSEALIYAWRVDDIRESLSKGDGIGKARRSSSNAEIAP